MSERISVLHSVAVYDGCDCLGNVGVASDQLVRRTLIELRIGRIRLAMAEAELMWAQQSLADGTLNVPAALEILDATMDGISGVKP